MNDPLLNDPPSGPPPAPPPAPDKPSGWLAAVLPVLLISACAELGISILNNSALPIYFTQGLHIQTKTYGYLMVPFFISEVLFKSPLGVLADRFGRKPLMLGGALVTVFTPLVFITTRYDPLAATAVITLLVFGFLRGLDGMGQAALWPALYAYVGDVVEEKKRGAAMGALNVVYMVGIAFSFLIGGFVDDTFGPLFTREATFGEQMGRLGGRLHHGLHRAGHGLRGVLHHPTATPAPVDAAPVVAAPVLLASHQPGYYYPSFILASVLFGIAVLAALSVRGKVRHHRHLTVEHAHEHSHEHGHDETMTWEGFVAALRTVPQFLGLAFVTFLGIGCISLLVKKFALDEYGMSETAFGALVLWPALAIAAVAVPAGLLADRWGKTRCVRLGFVLCALGLWGIPILHHLRVGIGGFMASAGLLGVGFVLAFPAWLALLTELGGEKRRGTVFAAVSTAQGVGALGGVFIGTQLYDGVGHIAPFVAAAVLVTAGTLLTLVFVREGALKRSEESLARLDG